MGLYFILITSISCLMYTCGGFKPGDNYLINCGSPTNSTVMGRVFISEKLSSNLITSPKEILASQSSGSDIYQTARVFTGISSYQFSVARGRHWVRLHFAPFDYQDYQMDTAKFAVSSQAHFLLVDFMVSSRVVKEYSLNVTTDDLVLTFIPSKLSFAFVNAIEVISVPETLITSSPAPRFVGGSGTFQQSLSSQVLETVHRVNMGGPLVEANNDTLTRTWQPGTGFLVEESLSTSVNKVGAVVYVPGYSTVETAPRTVYGTCTEMNSLNTFFNVTWEFEVDPGFHYSLRFHFCDIVSLSTHQLYFNLYIDSVIAVLDIDLSSYLNNTLSGAYNMDFITQSPKDSNKIRVSIGPSTVHTNYRNAILNGLEIMKMNNSKGHLSNRTFVPAPVGVGGRSVKQVIASLTLALGLIGCSFLLLALFVVCCMLSKNRGGKGTSVGSRLMSFPFAAVKEATNNFDESRNIGVGGFGKVYKGKLNGTEVAVKRGNPKSEQGLAEFRTEIDMLSQFHHPHLVSLIGYCDEDNEMILIYEYMKNGTVRSHLYGSGLPNLTWKQRLEICIGAARGLNYLHTGESKPVIHRDVKSTNILLDDNFRAKIADVGLSKNGPELDQTHVSTLVKGSFGYLDPEYFRRQQLTAKSDVYSFGVVLFEVLCARPVIDLRREMVNLAEWAMQWQKKGQLDQIIDQSLLGDIRPDSLSKFAETGEKCLADNGVDRPCMGDVLLNLEYALQLQEAVVDGGEPEDNCTN